jgi:predicted DNA-binding WGR domain protein
MSGAEPLRRIDPARNMARFYRLAVHPDLFAGGGTLLREWGRIGRPGRVRIEPFSAPELAEAAGARIERTKRGRGYR